MEIADLVYGGIVLIFGVAISYMIVRKLFLTSTKWGFLSLDWRASAQGQISTLIIIGLAALGIFAFIATMAHIFKPKKRRG